MKKVHHTAACAARGKLESMKLERYQPV
jgi:hypothetical protein